MVIKQMADKGKQMMFNLKNRKLNLDTLNNIKQELNDIIERMILGKKIDATKLELIIHGKEVHLKSNDINPAQKPEEYTKSMLINPILTNILKYKNLVKEASIHKNYPSKNGKNKYRYPDYMSKTNNGVLIEAEPLGKDLRKNENSGLNQVYEWLDSIQTREEVGIATNGIQWILVYKDSKNNTLSEIKTIDLKDLFITISSKANHRSLLIEPESNLDELVEEFYLTFAEPQITETIEDYSSSLKEQKEKITEKFYRDLLDSVFGYEEKNKKLQKIAGNDYLTVSIISQSATVNDRNKFSIVFLNRLIFIKFLENKKIVPNNYLTSLWKNYEGMPFHGGATFYKTHLIQLFYGIFNTPIKNREDRNNDDIPYLNGGLFRETVKGEKDYDIRDEAVKKIINLLDQYEFELKESGTNLGTKINADILGSIYEKTVNIITGGFKKLEGAYYTPDEITVHISNQTLFPYLLKKFKNHLKGLGWKEEELGKYTSISDMITNRVSNDNGTWRDLIEITENTKILDPSCGSGHFLMSALDLLVKLKKEMYRMIGETKNDFEVKSKIILDNLFGVDIDPMAVEIAKLRLWLSLIQSMDINNKSSKEMLPNIEYNIIQGDSLIGISSLNEIKQSIQTDYNKISKDISEYEEKLKKYKGDTSSDAPSLREELRSKLDQISMELTPFYTENPEYQSSNDLNVNWPIVFSSVFRRNDPGFDIVIGNPPYGDILDENKKNIVASKYIKLQGDSISEIAGLFTFRFTELLRNDGYLSFIITYSITFNKELSKVRDHLRSNFSEIYISTFDRDRCRIFSSMTQSVSILLCKEKGKHQGTFFTSKFYRTMPNLTDIHYICANELLLTKQGFGSNFSLDHRLPKLGEEMNVSILEKIINKSQNLGNLIKSNKTKVTIYFRNSGNYWYNAWDFKPYDGTQIKELSVPLDYKNFVIVLINSNLMYFFGRIYGDGRHFNADLMNSFRVPDLSDIDVRKEEFNAIAEKLMNDLRSVYDQENRRFETSKIKSTINECDEALKDLYSLTVEECEYLKKYDEEVRG